MADTGDAIINGDPVLRERERVMVRAAPDRGWAQSFVRCR